MSGRQEIADLLKRCGEGDRSAFRTLYARTAAKLNAVTFRILQQAETAEEALQETYVRIWQNAASYDPQIASPIAWMAAIARNQAIDLRRRSGERIARASVADENLLLAIPAGVASDWGPALARLKTCLAALPEDRRSLVVLAYCLGYTRDELAERVGKPAATIKSTLRRTLMALKECLDGGR